jgi:hypothetical protein
MEIIVTAAFGVEFLWWFDDGLGWWNVEVGFVQI